MDGLDFDLLARNLATTRRRGLARFLLAAFITGPLPLLAGADGADAGCFQGGRRCRYDSQCCSGRCPHGWCAGGNGNTRCRASKQRCRGKCVDTRTNPKHCGGCGRACGCGSTCCNGVCCAANPVCFRGACCAPDCAAAPCGQGQPDDTCGLASCGTCQAGVCVNGACNNVCGTNPCPQACNNCLVSPSGDRICVDETGSACSAVCRDDGDCCPGETCAAAESCSGRFTCYRLGAPCP